MSNSANNQCEKHKLTTKTINQSGQVLTISGCHSMDEVFVATSTLNIIPTTNVHGYMKVVGEYHEVFATQLVKAGFIPISCRVTPDIKNQGKYTKMPSSLSSKTGKTESLLSTPWNASDLRETFTDKQTNSIGILLGEIKNKTYEGMELAVLDFEKPHLANEFFEKLGKYDPILCKKIKSTYMEKTRRGHHIFTWVPLGVKKEGLAYGDPVWNEKKKENKPDLLIELLSGKKSWVVISPSPGYEPTNGPLLDEKTGCPNICTLDVSELEDLLYTCKMFDKLQGTTSQNTPLHVPRDTSEKNRRLNEYLLNYVGVPALLESRGFTIIRQFGDRYHCCHPNSTNFNSPNCTFGPREQGAGNTFISWSPNCIVGYGKPVNALTFYLNTSTDPRDEYAKLCRMAKANGIKLEDDVDESRFSEFQPPDQTETKSSEVSGDMVNGSSIEERRRIARETRDALRSPVENSLINFCTDLIRESADSKHTSQVIPGATTLTHLGDFSSKWISYQNNVPVLHAIITAKTGAGKEHPARIFEAVGPKLNKIYRWHEANYGPNGKIKDHSDCKLYPQDILPNPTSTLVPMSILTPTSTESDENIAFADCRKENKKPKKNPSGADGRKIGLSIQRAAKKVSWMRSKGIPIAFFTLMNTGIS